MPQNRSYYESILNNPNVRKALNLISKAEGADYFTLVGQGTNNTAMRKYGTAAHPKDLGFRGVYNPRVNAYSTAAGRYQIVGATWKGLQRKGIVGRSFDPHEQDIAAIALIDEKPGALNDVLNGDVAGFVGKTREVWESFKLLPFGRIAGYWSGGGSAPSSGAIYASQSSSGGSYIPAVFELSGEQSALAKKSIPKEWRGMIVLTLAAVVFYMVLSNSGQIK